MNSLADKWLRRKDFSNFSKGSGSNPAEQVRTGRIFSKGSRISNITDASHPTKDFSNFSKGSGSNAPENNFDAEHWQQEISRAINKAMKLDDGALEYCALFMPLLHRRYMQAANDLDTAYTAQDAKQIRQALREYDHAAEQTRKAASQPLTADQLSPGECSRFCQAHLSDKGGECPYLNQLNGCTLWEAKNKRSALNDLPVYPTRYLESHQREIF
jgi:hypothetical protein